MTNRRSWSAKRGAVVCLALFGIQVDANESDQLLVIEPDEQNGATDEEFHEAIRRSLRGRSYTLVTAPSGAHLLLIEDEPKELPVAFPPNDSRTDEVKLLAGAPGALERARAINVLGDFPDATSHAIVTSALADPDARVREEAVDSLSQIDGVASVASIQLALRDPDQRVRSAAITALAEIDAAHLLRDNWDSMSPADRLTAVDAVGDTRGDAATGFLKFAAGQDDEVIARTAAAYLAER